MRLIDADKIDEELENWKQGKTDTNSYVLVNHFQGIIRTVPTVEERKHGHWIGDEQGDIKCSNCDRYLYPMGIRTIYISDICRKLKTNFCPECGAIMDEVSEDDN